MSTKTPRAMILAAGFGTRLGELTKLRPKPMLPICGAPLVRWAVLWLRHYGVCEIVINLHHMGEQIRDELGDGSSLGVSIAYSPEEVILGTGGGLREARPLLDDGSGAPIVVLNGKVLHELDLDQLMAVHREREAEATMVLRRDEEGVWGGSLGADASGRLVRLLGEMAPGVESDSVPDLMFTGIHVLEPRFLDRVPREGEQCIIRTAYVDAFREGKVGAMVTDRYWWEHSTPERYIAGVCNVLDGKVELPFAEGMLRGVDPSASVAADASIQGPVWVGPQARIESGARVGPYVQLGAGARVGAGVELERTVVWGGVEVRRSAKDEVIVTG